MYFCHKDEFDLKESHIKEVKEIDILKIACLVCDRWAKMAGPA